MRTKFNLRSKFWSIVAGDIEKPEPREWLDKYHDPTLADRSNFLVDLFQFACRERGEAAKRAVFKVAQEKEGQLPACTRCKFPACCWQTVLWQVTWDGLPVARHLRLAGRDTPELRARLKEHGEAVGSTPKLDWWKKKVLCPLIQDDGLCSIYDVRGLICRKYYIGGDPEVCIKAADNPDTKCIAYQANTVEQARVEWSWTLELEHEFGIRRASPALLPLSSAVLRALEALDAKTKDEFQRILTLPGITPAQAQALIRDEPLCADPDAVKL